MKKLLTTTAVLAALTTQAFAGGWWELSVASPYKCSNNSSSSPAFAH
jgi:hypothetical protein